MTRALCAAVLLAAGLARPARAAEEFRAGGHVAYSAGGDVADERFGAGAQFAAAVNDVLSLDLAGTFFSEENRNINCGITSFALSLRGGKTVVDGTHLYLGAGPNLNLFTAPSLAASIGYHACAGGEFMLGRGLEFLAEYRYSIVDVDNLRGRSFRYSFGLVRLGLSYAL